MTDIRVAAEQARVAQKIIAILDARPRPVCRDCADEDGTCPGSGLPCDMRAFLTQFDAALGSLEAALQSQPGDSAPPTVEAQFVPLVPTQLMCQAGQDKAREWPHFPLRISPIYQAMLAAAPKEQK